MNFRPGLFLALLGAFGYTMDYIFISFVIHDIGSEIPTVIRYIFQAYVCSPVLFVDIAWIETTWKEWIGMFINGLLLGALTFISLLSVRYIPPLDTTTIFGTEPAFVLIIAHFVLKERMGKFEVIVIAVLIGGILLVCQPNFIFHPNSSAGSSRLIGMALSLTGTFLLSVVDCMCRMWKLSGGLFLSTIQAIGAVVFTLIALGYEMTKVPTSGQWIYIASAGAGGVLGRVCVTFAMKFENASYISSVVAAQVVITLIVQIIYLHIIPDILSIFGSILVASCIMVLSFRKQIIERLDKLFQRTEEQEPALAEGLNVASSSSPAH